MRNPRYPVWFLVVLVACRDAPRAYEPPFDFETADTGLTRLTLNARDDRVPVFTRDAESVVYTASGFFPFSRTRGLLLEMSQRTGRSSLLLTGEQDSPGSAPWFAGPAFSGDGERVAFVELMQVEDLSIRCNAGFICPFANAQAILGMGILRVKRLGGRFAQDELQLPIAFCCRRVEDRPSGDFKTTTVAEAHPFQQQFQRDGVALFRPSWSPDGNAVVYSDGLRLHIVDLRTKQSSPIANTADGVWPAWSPDGTRIAFVRLMRSSPSTASCTCMTASGGQPAPAGIWDITYHSDAGVRGGVLTIIRPDGSDARVYGTGEAPAWMPDGKELLFQRATHLWRLNVQSGSASPIPLTENGFEPAVSADGAWLVFARRVTSGNYDIYKMRL